MASYLELNAIGRLGQDAEVKFTAQGKEYVKFSVATDKWVPKGQEPQTVWVRVTVWGNLATTMTNLIEQHGALAKGDLVFVKGEPDVSSYTANNGEARASLELNAREIKLLSSKAREAA